MSPKKRSPSDLLPPATLHILLELACDNLHGYAIKTAVEERTNGAVTLGPGTLYEAVHRLSTAGWIEEVERTGRRRVYGITAAGRRALDEELERMDGILAYARSLDLVPRTQ